MSIKSLYRKYVQKSRMFLYPALEIKRGSSVTPIETYLSWNGNIIPEDRKLICLYHLREDPEYKVFEKTKLIGNKLFEDFYQVEDNKAVYIFNFDEYDNDWGHFLKGRYSMISPELKRRIKDFFKTPKSPSVYMDSFLHPDKYFHLYSELLGVDLKVLKEVGELCSGPDLELESLEINVVNNNLLINNINQL